MDITILNKSLNKPSLTEMVNAVAPEPQKSLESAQLTPAEAKRIKRIEDLVQPWKQKLTDHHIYDVSSKFSRF